MNGEQMALGFTRNLTPAERGHRNAARAARRADARRAGWTDAAMALGRTFAASMSRPWLVEELRTFGRQCGFADAPDGRAWGDVIQRLRKAGEIEAFGVAPAKSSHGSLKPTWRRVVKS